MVLHEASSIIFHFLLDPNSKSFFSSKKKNICKNCIQIICLFPAQKKSFGWIELKKNKNKYSEFNPFLFFNAKQNWTTQRQIVLEAPIVINQGPTYTAQFRRSQWRPKTPRTHVQNRKKKRLNTKIIWITTHLWSCRITFRMHMSRKKKKIITTH